MIEEAPMNNELLPAYRKRMVLIAEDVVFGQGGRELMWQTFKGVDKKVVESIV